MLFKPCSSDDAESLSQVVCTAWSHHSPPLFAAGLDDGSVSIFDSSGSVNPVYTFFSVLFILLCAPPHYAHRLRLRWGQSMISSFAPLSLRGAWFSNQNFLCVCHTHHLSQ
jgi:WD40 repeat protein